MDSGRLYTSSRSCRSRSARPKESGHTVARRGPLLRGVDDQHVAGLGRDVMRAVGNPAPEPKDASYNHSKWLAGLPDFARDVGPPAKARRSRSRKAVAALGRDAVDGE